MCSNPERRFYPQRSICHASMELEAAERRYDEIHADEPWHDGTFKNSSKDWSRSTPYKFRDGVQLWIAPVDVNPDDDFLSAPQDPVEPVDEVPGEQ